MSDSTGQIHQEASRFRQSIEDMPDAALVAWIRKTVSNTLAADLVANPDIEAAAVALCQLDNVTGPDVAIEDIPCDIHRKAAKSAIDAALGVSEDTECEHCEGRGWTQEPSSTGIGSFQQQCDYCRGLGITEATPK